MSVLVISGAVPPGPLDAPADFVHEQIVDDPDETYLSWTAVSGADVYNVRLESDNSVLSSHITGSAGSGAYAGKLVYRLGSGTGGESPLTASTLYRVYLTALLTDGSRESGPSTVDGAMTANAPSGGSSWPTNTPSFTPIVPWAAGPGAACVGGSGIDAPSGGSAAAQTIYLCDTLARLQTACNATGRRWAIWFKSGVYNIGTGGTDQDGEVEIRNDGRLTIIDLSPSPGAVFKGGGFTVWSNSGAGETTRGKDIAWINIRLFDKARTNGVTLGTVAGTVNDTGTYERLWFGHSTAMFSNDQIITWVYHTEDCGIFASMIAKGVRNSVHPESPHSTGIIVEWIGQCTNFGVMRCILSDNAWRNPLIAAAQGLVVDNLIHNFQSGVEVSQANDEYTTGYPTQTTVAGNIFVRGADGAGAEIIRIGSPNTGAPDSNALHTGSRVCVIGNAAIGYTDTTQANLVTNGGSWTLESSPVPNTPTKGYVHTNITVGTAEEAAKVTLLCSYSGAWPAARDTTTQGVLDGIAASAATPGSGGDIIDAGSETYPTLAVNTADFTSGGDPAPGISAMTVGGFALGAAGLVLSADASGKIYSAFQHWVNRRLASVCGVGP